MRSELYSRRIIMCSDALVNVLVIYMYEPIEYCGVVRALLPLVGWYCCCYDLNSRLNETYVDDKNIAKIE